ncbi:MAG: hypothetical protein ACRC2O_12015, partial [Chitinophagaceae bacterium]
MTNLNKFLYNNFIFSPEYRVKRHIIYWLVHITVWACFWMIMGVQLSFARQILNMTMWVPLFIFFGYPLVYFAIPYLLLEQKVVQFFFAILSWGAAGLYFDQAYRSYLLIPLQEAMGLSNILPRGPLSFCYLCMTTSAVGPMIIKFFKLLNLKQQEVIKTEE